MLEGSSAIELLETVRGHFPPCVTGVGLFSDFRYLSFWRRTFEIVLGIVRQIQLLYSF